MNIFLICYSLQVQNLRDDTAKSTLQSSTFHRKERRVYEITYIRASPVKSKKEGKKRPNFYRSSHSHPPRTATVHKPTCLSKGPMPPNFSKALDQPPIASTAGSSPFPEHPVVGIKNQRPDLSYGRTIFYSRKLLSLPPTQEEETAPVLNLKSTQPAEPAKPVERKAVQPAKKRSHVAAKSGMGLLRGCHRQGLPNKANFIANPVDVLAKELKYTSRQAKQSSEACFPRSRTDVLPTP
ncbi:hypothetical protein ACJJTC_011604 [Scirpophaga incertulas]